MTKQFVIDKVIPRLVEEAGYKNPRDIEAALKFYYIDTAREESVNTMRQNYAQVCTNKQLQSTRICLALKIFICRVKLG